MKTMLRSAAVLAAFATLTWAAATATLSEDVKIRWKLAKGESLRYRMTQEQTMDSEMMGELENTSGFVFRQDVADVAADGLATIDVRYEAIRLENGGPMSMSYDSTRTGDATKRNDARLAKVFEPMLAAKLRMQLEPTGHVTKFEGVDAMLAAAFPGSSKPNPMDPASMLKEMFNEESLRKLVEINVFPTEAIPVGHKWNRSAEQKIPMFGALKLSFDNTLAAVEDHAGARCAKIAVAGTMELVSGAEPAMPMKISLQSPSIAGTMFFALDSGRLIEAQIDTTMDMHMEAGEGAQGMQMDMAIDSVQRIVLISKDAPYWE